MEAPRPTLDYARPKPKPPPSPLSPRFYLAALTLIPITFIVFSVGIRFVESGSLFVPWLCAFMFLAIPILFGIGLGLQINGR